MRRVVVGLGHPGGESGEAVVSLALAFLLLLLLLHVCKVSFLLWLINLLME